MRWDLSFNRNAFSVYYSCRRANNAAHTNVFKLPASGLDICKMTQTSTNKVTSDISKNRLYIKLSGTIRKKELGAIYTDVRFCVADLQPEFDVITDLRACRLGHLSAIPEFKRIVQYLVNKKVRKTIRVVGRTSLILKQVSRITKGITGYKPIYVSTIEEAEERLAEKNTFESSTSETT